MRLDAAASQFLISGRDALPVVDDRGIARGLCHAIELARTATRHGASELRGQRVGDVTAAAMAFYDTDSARSAALRMASGGYETAVVSSADGALLGVWTASAALALLGAAHGERRHELLTRPLRHLMTSPKPVPWDVSLAEVIADLAADDGRPRIVLDTLHRPVGTVSAPDLCHIAVEPLRHHPQPNVIDLACPVLARVDADTPLTEVTGMFLRHQREWLLVSEGASLVGLVRAVDLLRTLWGARAPS